MKPGAQKSDESNESSGRAEQQSGDDENKGQAKQGSATPLLANKVVLQRGARKSRGFYLIGADLR